MPRVPIALLALALTGCEGVDPVSPDPCAGALTVLYDGESLTASRPACGALELQARPLGEGTFLVDFELSGDTLVPTVQALHGPATFRGLSLEGDYALDGQAPLRLWRQGYQSWSWSGVVEVEESALGPDGLPMASGDRDTMSFLSDDPSTSWWVGLVGRPAGPSLLAGAQEGIRSEPITGMEAYHIGMALLREAAGEQTYILACGAPLLPSLGWVEGFRTGTDITSALNPTPELATLRWQARSTAARAWSNGRWWWNDADAVLVGEALDERTMRGALGSWALSGGAWILGDDLRQLPSERLELALHPGLALRHPRPLSPLDAPSGWDLGPLAEALNPDDTVPLSWIADQASALLNLSDQAMTGVVTGGKELFTGASTSMGTEQEVPSGEARIWSH